MGVDLKSGNEWKTKKANGAQFQISMGDLGIYAAKIKSRDVRKAYEVHLANGLHIPGGIHTDPAGQLHYFVQDPYGNLFQVVCEHVSFKKQKSVTGGTAGSIIGVSNIDTALTFYANILNYDQVVYDQTGLFEDFLGLEGGDQKCRRVLLKPSKPKKGGFSPLFGPTQIELIQVLEKEPRKVFEGREWGELGFIHLCFDVHNMNALKTECQNHGFPFTVDSMNGFDMGTTSGHFSYVEDPDGTLIEFVETHRLPIIQKLGWYLNLKKPRST